MRLRYAFNLRIEVPGSTLADAQERALRLFRGRVRRELAQSVAYVGAYRGSFFQMSRAAEPKPEAVNLKKRARKLATLPRPPVTKAPAGFLFAEVSP